MKAHSLGKFAIFASGTGTNALALIDQARELGCFPEFVLVNKADSPLRDLIPTWDIPCYFISSKVKGSDLEFEKAVLDKCKQHNVSWVFLAGFLKILSPQFVQYFQNENGVSQILNIHPSLLPKYPGLGGYKKAWENQDEQFGHTIHIVTSELDSGPVLFQKAFETSDFDSLDELRNFGKEEENKSYQKVFKELYQENLLSEGERIWLKGFK